MYRRRKKTTYLENCNQLAPVSYGKILHVLKTAIGRIERPIRISLLNSSRQKASRYDSIDGCIAAFVSCKKEHIRNTKVFKSGSNISHAWLEGHTIDFENARVIDRGNSRVRKTLESWRTAITSQADNNSTQLPRQYSILL